MKIVHFAKYYPPEYGGIESVTEALAEDHAAAGNNVEVVCFTREAASVDSKDLLTLRRVKVLTEKLSQPFALSYLLACVRAAREADIIHVHTPNMLAAIAILLLPRRVPAVVHWHADVEGKGILGYLLRPLERAMLSRADVIVTTTQAYAKGSSSLAPFADRIEVIPIGIADSKIISQSSSAQPPYVLFVGRLVSYKGLSVLLDAIPNVRSNAEFRIVGVGPQESELKTQARRLRITDRVKFLGRVDEQQLLELFRGAALFCLPSVNRLEAFGVVLLEAMRAGRAIVATNIPGSGVPWVNAAGVNVPVKDPQAMARALERLLTDPERAAQLGKDARTRFDREFSRRVMSARFLKLYGNILNLSDGDILENSD